MSTDSERSAAPVAQATRTIALSGEYDLSRVDELRNQLLGGPPASCVDVDMGEVTFIDSSALGVFVEARVALAGSSARIVVRSLRPAPLRLFQITGLTGCFGIE